MDLAKITRLARRRYRQIVGESAIKGLVVPVACYLAQDDYQQICDDPLSFFEHWATIALLGEMVTKRGAIVVYVPLFPEDYFKWCKKHKFSNTPQSRARYAIWLTSGELDGVSGQFDDVKE